MEAAEQALKEQEEEEQKAIKARNKGEKIKDSNNIGYLITYKDVDENGETDEGMTFFDLIYGYDFENDSFCIEIGDWHSSIQKYDDPIYENAIYDFENFIAAMLSNFVRVEDGQVPTEEGVVKSIWAFEDNKFGNTIKVYDKKDAWDFEYRPTFEFLDRSDEGILDDTLKEKYYISTYNTVDFTNKGEHIEIYLKDYQYKNYYASCHYEYGSICVSVYFKPLLNLTPGDVIIRYSFDSRDMTLSHTELIEKIIDELCSTEIIYSCENQMVSVQTNNEQVLDEQQKVNNQANEEKIVNEESETSNITVEEMNVKTGLFKKSAVKTYETVDLKNDVGIQVKFPIFYDFEFSGGGTNAIASASKETDLGNSYITICLNTFHKEDFSCVESQREYFSTYEETEINGHKCYILGNEYDQSCYYKAFIEAKPSMYVEIESISIEGAYYYDKNTCSEDIKNLLSLIDYQ